MPQYHEINMHSHCVVLASQLPVVLKIIYSPARPTQYLGMYIYYDVSLWLVLGYVVQRLVTIIIIIIIIVIREVGCGGVRCGNDEAIHAMHDLFLQNCTSPDWGILLVDASNLFNSLSCATLLWNTRVLWPRCSRCFFVCGSEELLYSKESVTQGDPLSMFLYAVDTLPLIKSLRSPSWTQIWYADDASACGHLTCVCCWFDLLLQCGLLFGYFPTPLKCLILVPPQSRSIAESLFGLLDVKVVAPIIFRWSTCPGVFCIGEGPLVGPWCEELAVQATFAAFTRSLQHEWTFLQRVVPCSGVLFAELERTLLTHFLPAVLGCEVSALEQHLFSLWWLGSCLTYSDCWLHV